jgi:hypothetical protein
LSTLRQRLYTRRVEASSQPVADEMGEEGNASGKIRAELLQSFEI